MKDNFAPYLSRDKLRLIDPKTVAYIYGYNLEDTCTTNDMEVAAALMRADGQGLQNITEYDDHHGLGTWRPGATRAVIGA